jgi:outer membrane autotransporter protein
VVAIVEQVGPAISGAAAQATRVAGQGVTNTLDAHMADVRGASSGDLLKDGAAWIKPFFGTAEQGKLNGVSGYDVDSSGFVLGVDSAVASDWRVGLAFASSNSDVAGKGGTNLDIDTVQFIAYGSYAIDARTALDLSLGVASNEYSQQRRAFANSVGVADYEGTQVSLGANLSRSYKMNDHLTLIPAVVANVTQVTVDSYREKGAAINLDVEEATEDSILVAVKNSVEWTPTRKGAVLANVGVGYNAVDAASVTSSFAGNGPTFVTNGIEPEAFLITAGLGYRYVTAKNLEITAAYDLESRSEFLGNTASVKLKMPF